MAKSRSGSRRLWVVLLFALLFLASIPASARSYRISKFVSNVHIEDDGSALISEQITFVFVGSFQGIHRYIPVDYPGPNGTNYSLFMKVISVTGDDGAALKFKKETSGHNLKLTIYVPEAVDTTRTVNIEYSTPNATKFFDTYDEFYWNVSGNDWLVPIDYAATTVYLPANAASGLKAQAFSGVYGSNNREKTEVEGSVVSTETANPLPMRGGLTVDVYIPQGVLHKPGAFTQAGWFLRSNPIVTLPLFAFAVMFGLWYWKGRDPNPGMSVAPMYAPPEKITPAEAGTLVDDSIDPRDITSILVDLAVRGYIKIVETAHKVLLFSSKDYELHLVKDRTQWNDLSDFERTMLEQIFLRGDVTNISDLKNRFYVTIPILKKQILSGLKQKGMYSVDPDSAHGYAVGGAILIASPYALLQWLQITDFFAGKVPAFASVAVALLIVVLFGRQLTAKTLLGARTKIQVLGFEEFMNRVDGDRLKRMPPDTFEKYLPYAMALGVEHHWAKAFEGIVQNQPSWYQSAGGYPFSPPLFVNNVNYMTQQASTAFTAAPRSNSSSSGWSGGGGGGFSGGGFGGGGGGAF
jgi:uncharacterized membrane protein